MSTFKRRVISESDLVIVETSARRLQRSALTELDSLVGKAARRYLPAGRAILARDVATAAALGVAITTIGYAARPIEHSLFGASLAVVGTSTTTGRPTSRWGIRRARGAPGSSRASTGR